MRGRRLEEQPASIIFRRRRQQRQRRQLQKLERRGSCEAGAAAGRRQGRRTNMRLLRQEEGRQTRKTLERTNAIATTLPVRLFVNLLLRADNDERHGVPGGRHLNNNSCCCYWWWWCVLLRKEPGTTHYYRYYFYNSRSIVLLVKRRLFGPLLLCADGSPLTPAVTRIFGKCKVKLPLLKKKPFLYVHLPAAARQRWAFHPRAHRSRGPGHVWLVGTEEPKLGRRGGDCNLLLLE